MDVKYQSVKGMNDVVPGEVEAWQILEYKTRRFLEGYGFREIRTPLLESTELFSRSIGEASDIVHKEMYTFEDRGGRSLTLRPEMTAAVARAVLEHHLLRSGEPTHLYYWGSMYRAERPQAGRQREFHQMGTEVLNTDSPLDDARLIVLVRDYLAWVGLSRFTVRLNNLGTAEDREIYARKLAEFFNAHQAQLCPDCQYRLSKNVLRIFDCKVAECQPIITKAPDMELSKEAKKDFEKIQLFLREAGVPVRLEPKLVRGLDYYTGCVFEVTAEGLGAQDALLAGGRYDGLFQSLGGPRVGAVGFALGVERLLAVLGAHQVSLRDEALKQTVYVAGLVSAPSSDDFYRQLRNALVSARKRGVISLVERSLSNHLKHANKIQAGYAVIVGEEEFHKGEVTLKHMVSGIQTRVKLTELASAFI